MRMQGVGYDYANTRGELQDYENAGGGGID